MGERMPSAPVPCRLQNAARANRQREDSTHSFFSRRACIRLNAGFRPGAGCNAPSAVIPVTTNLDVMDAGPACGAIFIGMLPGPDGLFSLREAICAANNTPGGPHNILPAIPPMPPIMVGGPPWNLGALPVISAPMIIGGGPQMIVIDGTAAGSANGLTVGPLAIAGVVQISWMTIQNFQGHGIEITGGPAMIQITHIGVDIAGVAPMPNGGNGIYITGSAQNIIGGGPGLGNIISANIGDGIKISGPTAFANTIMGNKIGTDIGGMGPDPNGMSGVEIDNAPGNMVGGLNPGEENVIAYNHQKGVYIHGSLANGSVVHNNKIGTDVSGTLDAGNLQQGVMIDNGSTNVVGGPIPGSGNLISGNDMEGILITGSTANLNKVHGNKIGTDLTGTAPLPNAGVGVHVDNAPGNNIGGDNPGEGNQISGNGAEGVLIENMLARNNTVKGNRIGVDATQSIDLGNAMDGVRVTNAMTNTIGGTTPLAGNLIVGNDNDGVRISGSGAYDNIVQGNSIGGSMISGLQLPNSKAGVFIQDAHDNIIGGVFITETNTILWNSGEGIVVKGGTAIGNLLSRNLVFGNGGMGIDLENDGVTGNDLLDADTGANQRQNFPHIDRATVKASTMELVGELRSNASTTYRLEFYANQACDPLLHGEGEFYLGAASKTTNASGISEFGITLPVTATVGFFVTGIAIDPSGNTSEYSPCRLVTKKNIFLPAVLR